MTSLESLAAMYESRALDCESTYVRGGDREWFGRASAYRQVAHELRREAAREEMVAECEAAAIHEQGPF